MLAGKYQMPSYELINMSVHFSRQLARAAIAHIAMLRQGQDLGHTHLAHVLEFVVICYYHYDSC